MVLQAFIDDSRDDNGGEVFCLGGYMATAARWIEFSNKWKEKLNENNLTNAKIKEMRKRYRNERMNENLSPFIDIIEEYAEYEISFCMEMPAMAAACEDYSLVRSKDTNPYYLGWNSIVSRLTDVAIKEGLSDGIEFIFDIQAEQTHILGAWAALLETAPKEHQKFIKNSPSFRDDNDVLPLQAADICAWHSRKFFKANNFKLAEGSIFPWRPMDNYLDAIRVSMTPRAIRKTAKKLSEVRRYPYPFSWKLPS